jgi:hypothetical protein
VYGFDVAMPIGAEEALAAHAEHRTVVDKKYDWMSVSLKPSIGHGAIPSQLRRGTIIIASVHKHRGKQ